MKLRPEEESLATADLIQNLTFSGTPEALRDGIRALRDAGYALEEWAEALSGV